MKHISEIINEIRNKNPHWVANNKAHALKEEEKFKIDNFPQREYVADIYSRFFKEDSKHDIQYLFALIECYDIIKPKKREELEKQMGSVQEIIKDALIKFETKQLNQLNK